MKFLQMFPMLLLITCSEKPAQSQDVDFTDRILTCVIEKPEDTFVEFPQLYDQATNTIPALEDENLIVAEKLKLPGFTVVNSKREEFQLLGRKVTTITLKNDRCECEVSKVYYTTSNISEYIRTERIKCTRLETK